VPIETYYVVFELKMLFNDCLAAMLLDSQDHKTTLRAAHGYISSSMSIGPANIDDILRKSASVKILHISKSLFSYFGVLVMRMREGVDVELGILVAGDKFIGGFVET
jgi:hypothetical protein